MVEQSPFHAETALIEALSRQAIPVPCTENKLLFRQGEECFGLFILHSGQATLEMRSEAGEIVARFTADDSSLLGLPATLSGTAYSLTAIALRGSNVSLIQRSKFLDLMASEPALSLEALGVMAAGIRAARAALVEALARERR